MHMPLRQGYKKGRNYNVENRLSDFSHVET
jgi:hypothetical protein